MNRFGCLIPIRVLWVYAVKSILRWLWWELELGQSSSFTVNPNPDAESGLDPLERVIAYNSPGTDLAPKSLPSCAILYTYIYEHEFIYSSFWRDCSRNSKFCDFIARLRNCIALIKPRLLTKIPPRDAQRMNVVINKTL